MSIADASSPGIVRCAAEGVAAAGSRSASRMKGRRPAECSIPGIRFGHMITVGRIACSCKRGIGDATGRKYPLKSERQFALPTEPLPTAALTALDSTVHGREEIKPESEGLRGPSVHSGKWVVARWGCTPQERCEREYAASSARGVLRMRVALWNFHLTQV